jgi:predicted CoA-substrate-specific enzyme activase
MRSDTLLLAGIDVGAATAKAVVLNANKILSSHVLPTGDSVTGAAETVMKITLDAIPLAREKLDYVIATGYGRKAVSFADEAITEISCHAKGVNMLLPEARTVIDIGGQDSKVIEVDEKGNIVNFMMNDKCAAGTGRFLEVMAKVLNADIQDIGLLSLDGTDPCQISNTCTVFAESEMVALRADGKRREDILAGIHSAMAHRVAIMGSAIGFRDRVVFTGGVARNVGMQKALQDRIGKDVLVPENPQIVGALGAAIIARDKRRNDIGAG